MKHFTLNYWQISLLILGLVVAIVAPLFANPKPPPPIRIGVLHSLSGTMATSEKPLIDAVRLAVNEINASHDFLNRSIEIVVADGQSDPTIFAQEAERLITQENVSVIFGCWTSASRQYVMKNDT